MMGALSGSAALFAASAAEAVRAAEGYEAALGAEVTAPTLDGRVSLKVPAGSQSGRVMRLKGRGLPGRGKEAAGDLLYEIKVLAPTDLTKEERDLMQQFADLRRARDVPDPRAETMKE